MSQDGMPTLSQTLLQLGDVRDRLDDLKRSHNAFFKFLENATDNLVQSRVVDASSPDFNNLDTLIEAFSRDFNFRQEEIEAAIAKLRVLIDR